MDTILAQTFQDWELIVVDSCSDDGSWEFFQSYASDPRVTLRQAPRLGLYAGWNECLSLARGEYIYVATSDDTASPDLLEQLFEAAERFPEASLAMCDYQAIDTASRPIEFPYHQMIETFYEDLLDEYCVRDGKTEFLLMASLGGPSWTTMTSVLFRRSLLDKIGQFPIHRGSAGDFEWGLRAALASDFVYVPGRLATWRIHEAQASFRMAQNPRRLRRIQLACLDSVLNDPGVMVPAAWKRVPGWDRIISDYIRKTYYDLCGLYRTTALHDPFSFVRNVIQAAQTDPQLLLSRSMRLFRGRDFSCNLESLSCPCWERFRTLVRLFNAPWPPTNVDNLLCQDAVSV